ncbi:hypothetical protein FVE85_6324 [Porphyridium purpureum]|uniref:Uncharacterized protein n=1 Tax=Porphyridium purpureum TaxID=35688 RepID=A0A5J4Z433_PORPP|nr:hypothetical protein FVE85_6324 [Porphyridium purpureum]|eukprot:POR4013..scf295_1
MMSVFASTQTFEGILNKTALVPTTTLRIRFQRNTRRRRAGEKEMELGFTCADVGVGRVRRKAVRSSCCLVPQNLHRTRLGVAWSLCVLACGLPLLSRSTACAAHRMGVDLVDPDYPGTAVERMRNIRARVLSLDSELDLSVDWEDVRRRILWAGGLRDLVSARPGLGYTGHSFNDFNHCDLTAMVDGEADSENGGRVAGIHARNPLGEGIRIASLPELGSGGSWSTCMMGCNSEPPRDVAHIQFKSRIAFKLVWCPGPDQQFRSFVLVDDEGNLLNRGTPSGRLPDLDERAMNFALVKGSKYEVPCETCD